MSKTYIKDGVEYFSVNNAPSNKDLMTNVKQALAVAQFEMRNFEGQVSVDTAEALYKHLKEQSHA